MTNMKHLLGHVLLAELVAIGAGQLPCPAADSQVPVRPPQRPALSLADAPLVQPWHRIALEPDYSGAWVIAGDLDADGAVEIVSARNVDRNDVHYTSAAVAQRLDGTVLWRWGDPIIGRKKLHHDVACQIYDWDGDGRNEVVLCTEGYLVELEGATGNERRRFPLPPEATDCLVFVNLSGTSRPRDILVKTRYTQIWAYDHTGQQLWTARNPGGFMTAHQPVPVDLDSDGRDEIMAGYAMLNANGTTRWVYQPRKIELARGHCDCFRVLRAGRSPEEFRFVMTFCGANGIALLNGNGTPVWELTGEHFESVDVGRICAGSTGPGLDIAVDIDHRAWGEGPLWVLDELGAVKTKILTDYARHHALLDWTGDGVDEILIAQPRALFDGQGRVVARFALDPADDQEGEERLAMTGDLTGDGVPDVLLTTRAMTHVYLYKNERGKKPDRPAQLGTGVNFTLY
jgi:hypothetical protein